MCLAIPGKIKELRDRKVLVKYPEVEREALVGDTDLKVGDYVIVQMGVVTKIISKEDALEMQKAWQNVN